MRWGKRQRSPPAGGPGHPTTARMSDRSRVLTATSPHHRRGGQRVRPVVRAAAVKLSFAPTVRPSSGPRADPTTYDDTAVVTFAVTPVRYLGLVVTANSGWPAARVAEFEAYASTG